MTQQLTFTQKLATWIYTFSISILSLISDNIRGTVVAIVLIFIFMIGDYLSGIFASKRKKKIGFQSSKARWSLAKYVVYLGAIIGTLIIGLLLHAMDCFGKGVGLETHSSIIDVTFALMKSVMYLITWIEAVSIVENLLLVYPDNEFLKIMHKFLIVDFIKLIPTFSKYLKEQKNSQKDQEVQK